MSYVRTFENFRAPRRFDEEPFVSVEIQEAANADGAPGTFATIDTVALDPVDTDPSEPAARDLTTNDAELEEAWYRLVWVDADDAKFNGSPIFVTTEDREWRPTVAQVATLIQARTAEDVSGDEAGTFTADTRPTAEQVQDIIDGVVEEVRSVFASGEIPDASRGAAQRAATLKAAVEVEESFRPEEGDSPNTVAQRLRARADAAMSSLVHGSQWRDLFTECEPDDYDPCDEESS